jgi:hypothetical protein
VARRTPKRRLTSYQNSVLRYLQEMKFDQAQAVLSEPLSIMGRPITAASIDELTQDVLGLVRLGLIVFSREHSSGGSRAEEDLTPDEAAEALVSILHGMVDQRGAEEDSVSWNAAKDGGDIVIEITESGEAWLLEH